MNYKKFHQAVVLAFINFDGNSERFGNEIINILNEFRKEEQNTITEQDIDKDCAHARKYRLPSGRLFCPDCQDYV